MCLLALRDGAEVVSTVDDDDGRLTAPVHVYTQAMLTVQSPNITIYVCSTQEQLDREFLSQSCT